MLDSQSSSLSAGCLSQPSSDSLWLPGLLGQHTTHHVFTFLYLWALVEKNNPPQLSGFCEPQDTLVPNLAWGSFLETVSTDEIRPLTCNVLGRASGYAELPLLPAFLS